MNLKIFTENVEPEAINQIYTLAKLEPFKDAKIRIMPDVHAGAGRLMSRSEAKRTLQLEDFTKAMEGIYTTTATQGTIDESPMAYKNAEEIISKIKDTVEVINVIKPIYNFKAEE